MFYFLANNLQKSIELGIGDKRPSMAVSMLFVAAQRQAIESVALKKKLFFFVPTTIFDHFLTKFSPKSFFLYESRFFSSKVFAPRKSCIGAFDLWKRSPNEFDPPADHRFVPRQGCREDVQHCKLALQR